MQRGKLSLECMRNSEDLRLQDGEWKTDDLANNSWVYLDYTYNSYMNIIDYKHIVFIFYKDIKYYESMRGGEMIYKIWKNPEFWNSRIQLISNERVEVMTKRHWNFLTVEFFWAPTDA